jgi:acyl-CoA synthetase (AMP-forming)/AMP-acid ligase II
MKTRVDRCVGALLAHGIKEGDRIALWLPNLPHWPVCLFACARIGAILVALNTRWKSSEAAYVLEHSRPRLLIMQRRFLKLDYATYLDEIERLSPGAVSGVEQIIDAAAGTAAGGLVGAGSWDAFLATADTLAEDRTVRLPEADPSRPVLLQYTSGSTARPKGALISHRQILNYGVEYLIRLGVQRGDAYLNTQPLYHVGGSCGAMPVPLTLGCCVVMPHYYEARRVLELIQRERCVARSGAVTMYLDEMALPDFRDFDLTSLRAGWTGASPAVIERIRSDYPIEGMVNRGWVYQRFDRRALGKAPRHRRHAADRNRISYPQRRWRRLVRGGRGWRDLLPGVGPDGWLFPGPGAHRRGLPTRWLRADRRFGPHRCRGLSALCRADQGHDPTGRRECGGRRSRGLSVESSRGGVRSGDCGPR